MPQQARTQRPPGPPPYPAPRGYQWTYRDGRMELESLTPEKLSESERRNLRLDLQTDPARPEFQYPGSPGAVADSISAGLKGRPSTAKVKTREDVELGFLEKIAGWQAKLDETKVDPATGDPVPKYGDATRRSYQKLIDNATRKIKILSPEQEVAGKRIMSREEFVEDFTKEEGREPTEEELGFFQKRGYWK